MKMRFQKIKEFFQKLPRNLAERAFFTLLVLFLLALIFGGLLFYRYSILAQKKEPEVPEIKAQFQEKLYQKILKKWQEREEKLKATETKEYPDPFFGLTE